MTGTMPLRGRTVDFANARANVLNAVAERDQVVPLRGGRTGKRARGRPDRRDELRLSGGHVTFFAGRYARAHTLPALTSWLVERSDDSIRQRSADGDRRLEAGDELALTRFLSRIPEGDRTFFKEDVLDADVVSAWVRRGEARSLAVENGEVVGTVTVVPLQGWSSHVGEVRVIVDPQHRRQGAGARSRATPCSRLFASACARWSSR